MDYTKVLGYLIYQEKKDIEGFIRNEQSLDNLMLKIIEDSRIVNLPGAPEYVLDIYNAAYYITTLILLEKRPLLHFSSYLNIASHIAAAPGCQNNFHQLFECTSMAMVCNYLQLLKPKQLDYKVFYNKVELHFINYNVIDRVMFSNIVLDIRTAQKYDFYPDRFNPRPIIDALKESNKEDICNNIDYIKERIMELDTDQMQIATEMVFNKAEMTGKLYVADSLSTEEENVRIKMEEVLQMIGPGWNVFNTKVLQPMTEEDIDNAISEAEGKTIDGNNSEQIAVLKALIKQLEEENQQLKEIIRQQGVAAVNQDEVDKLKASIARLENDLEAFNTQDGKNRMTASQAAIFILTVCHHLGGLPNDKKALSPILQWGWGFSESTSERALGAEAQQSVADKTAQFLESFSPKLGRLIREFPGTFNELRKQKLKDNNDKKLKTINR